MVKHDSAFLRMWCSFKQQVIKKICLIIIAALGICQQTANAQQPPSVVILPFEIFSEKDLKKVGIASDSPMSVGAIVFICCGHQIHHRNILRERYLKD